MRIISTLLFLFILTNSEGQNKNQDTFPMKSIDLVSFLDTIWITEQTPIRKRDSLMKIYGTEAEEVKFQQKLYKQNHAINEKKIIDLLDNQGWPDIAIIGEQGNHTICNVLQHSSMAIRQKYLPMMREAVKQNHLQPRFLARAEDRLATDRGELQIYGGQIKFYPETKTFNVWPIFDPENVDKRRAEIGLEPMADFLSSRRFQLEWNVEEQIQRTKEFEQKKKLENKNE
jgi:hypothetical protein